MDRTIVAGRVGRRMLLSAGASALPLVGLLAQGQAAGVALVLGNSRYEWESALPNVRRDTTDMARRFQALGLRTQTVEDARRDTMRRAFDAFLASARGARLAVLYYAGHGVQLGGNLHFVPVDADLSGTNPEASLTSVAAVREELDAASARFLVFDACRNNPIGSFGQEATAQMARSRSARGGRAGEPRTLVLFSTAPGRIALDGPPGQNSPFAAALLRQLATTPVEMQSLAARLRRDLLMATQGRQVVWDENSFRESFMLQGPADPSARGGAIQGGGAGRSARGGEGGAGDGGGGWSADPAANIELPNAYATAERMELRLPRGLVAHRAPAGSRYAGMIGSFLKEGESPTILVVLTVDERTGVAELINAGLSGAITGRRAYWQFVQGRVSGDSIDYQPISTSRRYIFRWSDASGGWVTTFAGQGRGGSRNATRSERFTRLD